MKKIFISLLLTTVTILLLAGCGQTTQTPSNISVPSQISEPEPSSEPTPSSGHTQSEEVATLPEGEPPNNESGLSDEAPTVYFTAEITPEGLRAVYDALEWSPTGNLAVKITTGEPPNSNYLRQELIGELVKSIDGTYVECNTAYGGSRASTAMHYQVAKDHGFEPIDIMDENGSLELPVNNGEVLSGVNYVGASFTDYDSMLVLSHFKGHGMAGFGGAIKNISIGLGSSMGKVWIHTGGESTSGSIFGDTDKFQMAMAEAGLSVSDALGEGENIVYINVMNRLSVDCDCNGNPSEPDMHDIGILASRDSVALDQACLDLIWEADGNESFVQRVESRNGFLALEHGEEIGLGSRQYELINLD